MSGNTTFKSPGQLNTNQVQVLGFVYSGVNLLTDDYTLDANADIAKLNVLGPLTAADKTTTLPELTATIAGRIYHFENDSYYEYTLSPAGANDSIFNSGNGYGITLITKGSRVTLYADYANNKWRMLGPQGRIHCEGTVLHEPMNRLSTVTAGNTINSYTNDLTGLRLGSTENQVEVYNASANYKFPPGCYNFDGSGDYIQYVNSPDFDILGAKSTFTLFTWVRFSSSAAGECIIGQSDSTPDGNAIWSLYKNGSDDIEFSMISGGPYVFNISGAVAIGAWRAVCAVCVDGDLALYIDNGSGSMVQLGWEASADWSVDTFSGSLYIGQLAGLGTNYFEGRMQDLFICYNNTFNAAPDSGLTDSFPVPAAPMQLVLAA